MTNATPLSKELLESVKPRRKQKGYPNLVVGHPGNAGGVPSTYDEKYNDELDIYLKTDRLPTIEGFALHLGVDDTTLLNWANKTIDVEVEGKIKKRRAHPRFFATLKKLKILQKKQLINDGMYGSDVKGRKANPFFAMFLLRCNHGMVEPTKVDVTSNGKEIQQLPILNGLSNVPTNNRN